MAERLPSAVQPFLTWLTARPAPSEKERDRPAISFVWEALGYTFSGLLVGVIALPAEAPLARSLGLLIAWIITTSGLGLFQVVVFHYASHDRIFVRRENNRRLGRLISAILLLKHFDVYKKEHMLHHNANKLLTEDDEFADFVICMCRLEAGLNKRELRRRVLFNVVFSLNFHGRFLKKRVRASLRSSDPLHNAVGISCWLTMAATAAASGHLGAWALIWVTPVTILLQAATVGRILCEHQFPDEALIQTRGREFICQATSGVFPGVKPPEPSLTAACRWRQWSLWWLNMLTVQLFVRLFILVGDSPCHDFHHRRPATRKWTSYIHARQADVDAGCPGYPSNYRECWGFFSAVDQGLSTLSNTSPRALRALRDMVVVPG